MKSFDVTGFGEALVRFNAPEHMRLEQSPYMQVAVAACELNCCVSLAHLGLKTSYVTKLVDTWSAQFIINNGRAHHVDMSNVMIEPFDGCGRTRNGLCFIEMGIGPRASRQIYDRGNSAISKVKSGDFNWKEILAQTKWLHTSGITAALSEATAAEALTALKTAREMGVTTSFDLNFRSTLWTKEAAQKTVVKVMPYVDVLFGNEEDFGAVLGIKAEDTGADFAGLDPESYRGVAQKVLDRYPNIKVVGTTLREVKSALLNDWRGALMKRDEGFYVSRKHENLEIFDRTGGGDSFAAGIIYGLITETEPQKAVEFATAYSALSHTFVGDWNWATREETERLMKGGSARVQR